MEIKEICDLIHLQPDARDAVSRLDDLCRTEKIKDTVLRFRDFSDMERAVYELKDMLGDDENGMKMLSCMLYAAALLYDDIYAKKGIGTDIFTPTMKCYTRFINETYKMTGKLCFDRWWWTTRQSGGHLFRIGELEYEMKPTDDEKKISIHIPSDSVFTPERLDESIGEAQEFFSRYYPGFAEAGYYCHSWLLDPVLKKMLREDSNIVMFQNRFDIYDEGSAANDFLHWLFGTKDRDYTALEERTSLQKNVKRHLLEGGVIRNSYGRLI